ncbi:DUF3151 domain-containing protein [Corynebacterium epidermidicanis]|uniref:Putative DUF3151 family protein n=1 Tax=Corynebacterium epidermidicanis TaxID=1050174 RepID=A0A0G3GPF9_9CORY|nr:DUF3151 domain-containing protein [Corynebacterium epidermidicanis]AKK02470.1 putative DUF3151 family protein [Corynebacterium epidermidicanis]
MKINDMLAPPPVHLPEMGEPDAMKNPANPLAWALLAEGATDPLVRYAFARTGYHRGLDALRGNGWKGFGPVPWSHEPNRGVLRSIAQLALAARAIDEESEYDRCRALLSDCDPDCVAELLT